ILLADDRSYAFLFRDRRLTGFAVSLSSQKAAVMVSELRKAFEESSAGSYPPFDVLMSHELYKRMFAPIADQLVGVTHLVTAPSGALLSLPFGLLVTDPPPRIRDQDYTRVQWLAKQTAISLVPSVRSFVDLRAIAQPSSAPKSFIGFGDFVPYSSETIARAMSALPEECRSDEKLVDKYLKLVQSLGALPYTQIEVKAIARTFPENSAQIYLKQDFNQETLLTTPLDQYRIVYFATHALLPYEIQCQPEPSLIASVPPVESDDADGFIALGEVLRFRLDADLVVLSACSTGGPGLESGGESLSGLARAFFFAGARSLLVSHWAVQDQPTAIIMISMFERLRDDQRSGIADALRDAQMGILRESRKPGREYLSHPLYWAAFTLVGDGARNVAKI
ncbi:MAG: CHAT domain-containing protein, partial [Pseudomonadales bacterium]